VVVWTLTIILKGRKKLRICDSYVVPYTSETIDIKYYKFNREEERLTDNGQVDEREILTDDNLDNDYSTDDFDAGDRFTS
jgi:hypothetical protein